MVDAPGFPQVLENLEFENLDSRLGGP